MFLFEIPPPYRARHAPSVEDRHPRRDRLNSVCGEDMLSRVGGGGEAGEEGEIEGG